MPFSSMLALNLNGDPCHKVIVLSSNFLSFHPFWLNRVHSRKSLRLIRLKTFHLQLMHIMRLTFSPISGRATSSLTPFAVFVGMFTHSFIPR